MAKRATINPASVSKGVATNTNSDLSQNSNDVIQIIFENSLLDKAGKVLD